MKRQLTRILTLERSWTYLQSWELSSSFEVIAVIVVVICEPPKFDLVPPSCEAEVSIATQLRTARSSPKIQFTNAR